MSTDGRSEQSRHGPVAEIDISFARHGAFGGGNRWGLLGTFIAMQIERVLGAARTSAP